MPKTLAELQRDSARANNLAIGSADGSQTNDPLAVVIPARNETFVVSPQKIYAQSRLTRTFSALDTIADIWNIYPSRIFTIDRVDGQGNVVSSIPYAINQTSPRGGEVLFPDLNVIALEGTPLAGTSLRVRFDAILSDEWQAIIVTYKQRLAQDTEV